MAWTTPRTWVTGELVTASILNTDERDNLAYLKAGPIFDGATSITNTGVGGRLLTLTAAGGATGGPAIALVPNSGTVKSWWIGASVNAFNILEFTPSTANNGTTFTTPAMTLSDAGLLTVSGFGAHAFGAGGTGGNGIAISNTTSGVGNYAYEQIIAGTVTGQITTYSQGFTTSGTAIQSSTLLSNDSAGGLSFVASHASGVLRFYAGGTTLRWGVNAAGDFTFGASSHISDSSGTPTIGGGGGFGGGSVAGTDYAFVVTIGGASGSGVVTFGHTWSTAPVCVATTSNNAMPAFVTLPVSTTTLSLYTNPGGWVLNDKVFVLCRGY